MAHEIQEALSDFERTHAKKEAVKLARKILQAKNRLFRTFSLPRGKRAGLVEYTDQIVHALDEDGSDAVDDDFCLKKNTKAKKQCHLVQPRQCKGILEATRAIIQKLEATTLQIDAMEMSLELAEAGKHICCAERFDELKAYIQHELIMETEEAAPAGPCAASVPRE
jgi:hypothetical protein